MKPLLDGTVWITAILSLIIGGLIATAFVFMATSLDPVELLSVGTEPWMNALIAVAAFAGLAVGTALGLRLWHTKRLKALGGLLVAVQFVLVVGACVKVYEEYF